MGIKLIALRCAGYNNVDLDAAYGRIHVFRVPAYSPYAVAEHAMALLLTSIRRIHKAYLRTRDFNFSLNGLTGFDLHGKTVGVVGTGKIGRTFIDICRGFGMNVIAYDKFPAQGSGIDYVSLDELFARSDIISLHCPLTEETRHLFDRAAFAKMKHSAIFINTARGAVVNETDLIKALKTHQIAMAGIDVTETEPIRPDHPLLKLDNAIVTPHIAWYTVESVLALQRMVAEEVVRVLSGEGPRNPVN